MIDDNPPDHLGSEHLEPVKVLQYGEPDNGALEPSISNWVQHLWLWATNSFPSPDPDLVLIDCNFKDQLAPPLPDKSQGDPRGLLHGLAYISRAIGRNHQHPLGFWVYSQDGARFQSDAYALFCVGLFLAMLGIEDAKKDPMSPALQEACREYLQDLQGGHAGTAWRPALNIYRDRLALLINSGKIVLEKPNYFELTEKVATASDPALQNKLAEHLRHCSITWFSERGRDEVSLQSLFADCDSSRGAHSLIAELNSFLKKCKPNCEVWDAADWAYLQITESIEDQRQRIPRAQPDEGGDASRDRFQRQVLLVSTWLMDRVQSKNRQSATQLAERLWGFSGMQTTRAFNGTGMSWAEVVKTLDKSYKADCSWPVCLPWTLQEAVREVSRKLNIEFPFKLS